MVAGVGLGVTGLTTLGVMVWDDGMHAGPIIIAGVALFGHLAGLILWRDSAARAEQQHRETVNLALGDPIARHHAVVIRVARSLFVVNEMASALRVDSSLVAVREKFVFACQEAENLAPELITTALATGNSKVIEDAYFGAELIRWAIARHQPIGYLPPQKARQKFDELYGGVIRKITESREKARISVGAGKGDRPANRPGL